MSVLDCWADYTMCLYKGSDELNCLLETLLCFTDNSQVLCAVVSVYVLHSGVGIGSILTLPLLWGWPASQLHQRSNRSTPLGLIYIMHLKALDGVREKQSRMELCRVEQKFLQITQTVINVLYQPIESLFDKVTLWFTHWLNENELINWSIEIGFLP